MNKRISSTLLLLGFLTTSVLAQDNTEKVGRFTFSVGTPPLNSFVISMPDSTLNKTGFLNITAGVGFYYNDKNYLDLVASASHASPMAMDIWGDYEIFYALSVSLTNNHVIHSFLRNNLHYTIGANYTFYEVKFIRENIVEDPLGEFSYDNAPDLTFYKRSFGVTVGLRYRVYKHLMVGVRLNTSLYTVSTHKYEYSHIGYVDVIFRFGSKRD